MPGIDTSKIGQAAAEMMEVVEKGYPDDSVVVDVMVITCVHRPDEDGKIIDTETGKLVGDEAVDYWCSDQRLITQIGLLEIARAKAELGVYPSSQNPEDDE